MSDKAILRDVLESLKHLTLTYMQAANECDSDALRKALAGIAVDKNELRNAVFNLLHQMGDYKTTAADAQAVEQLAKRFAKTHAQMHEAMPAGAGAQSQRELHS